MLKGYVLLLWRRGTVLQAARSHRPPPHPTPQTNSACFVYLLPDCCFSCSFQAVEELLESLELERSSYHLGLSKVSTYNPAGGHRAQGRPRWSAGGRVHLHRFTGSCSTIRCREGALLRSGQRFRLKKTTFLLPAGVKLIRIPQVPSAGRRGNHCRGARVGTFHRGGKINELLHG